MIGSDGIRQPLLMKVSTPDVNTSPSRTLCLRAASPIRRGGNTHHVGYDASGNATTLVNAATGAIAASYEFDPFGNALKAAGEFAAANPFRFSTKYADAETGLVYYVERYYQPQAGR